MSGCLRWPPSLRWLRSFSGRSTDWSRLIFSKKLRALHQFQYNDYMNKEKTIVLALTGASGMPYSIRLMEQILAGGNRLYLIYSAVAQIVIRQEMGLSLPSR